MKSNFLPLLLLAAAVPALSVAVGGWQPIGDVNDPKIVAIAKFAVDKYNTIVKDKLVFVDITEGKSQVVAGIKYQLIVSAKVNDGNTYKYQAVVWVKPDGSEKLMSFTPLDS